MSWAPVLVGGDRRMYVSATGDLVELPREAAQCHTREEAVQHAIDARDRERSRPAADQWILDVDAEEIA
ncbi:hypothetical protein LO763_22295 [Glycomyces sp. A-F 0318]|uniref:hypothetical protein n=1 Tax=Glycomyces amatae TaxID=2881355 RepID=UPI001E54D6BA|nr:hypothetical protein [Glycomyces amatae]MCD0446349.1 hypothetical protein [Glycomyces amatae]